VAAVGIDSYADDAADAAGPAQDRLLGNDVPILEHLTNLDRLPDAGARLFALPPPLTGLGAFPVRAIAMLERLALRYRPDGQFLGDRAEPTVV
jgi:arylformamidase